MFLLKNIFLSKMIEMMKCFLKFNGLIGNITFSYVYVCVCGGGQHRVEHFQDKFYGISVNIVRLWNSFTIMMKHSFG